MATVAPAADLGQRLALLRLPDPSQKLVALEELWRGGALILVHLNHFDSFVCADQVEQLVNALADLAHSGISLAVIGPGEREAGRRFQERFDGRFPVLVDKDARSFDVIGAGHRKPLHRGTPSALADSVRSLRKSISAGLTSKPKLHVLGATHVIKPSGEVVLAWLNDDASAACPLDSVVGALDEAGLIAG